MRCRATSSRWPPPNTSPSARCSSGSRAPTPCHRSRTTSATPEREEVNRDTLRFCAPCFRRAGRSLINRLNLPCRALVAGLLTLTAGFYLASCQGADEYFRDGGLHTTGGTGNTVGAAGAAGTAGPGAGGTGGGP